MYTLDSLILTLRIIIIGMSIFTVVVWLLYYIKSKEPVAIAIITWLLNLVSFNIFRFLVVGDKLILHTDKVHIEATQLTSTWSAALHVHAVILLIVAYYTYTLKGRK